MTKPFILCILDGWGYRETTPDNAIAMAKTPTWDRLWSTWPHSLLEASGPAVGLPEGQMGNSEVGHMHIGGGRIFLQDLPRIDKVIAEQALLQIPTLQQGIAKLQASQGACHLMGLLSPGGVHSHQNHMVALARVLAESGIEVQVHGFLDGRDTPPKSALTYVSDFLKACSGNSRIKIATISGRYYAMDRDKRWDRTQKAYEAIVMAQGPRATSAHEAIETNYTQGITDEFIPPTVIEGYKGVSSGDGFLMANFRADRARQILTAFTASKFNEFPRTSKPDWGAQLGMVVYSEALAASIPALFPPFEVKESLGEILANAGLKQLRIAETEKYAHVTFFFNGGSEQALPGETRILVPSPKVATYDLQPEMAALELTTKLLQALATQAIDFVVLNYANTDMVGHTGLQLAAEKAVEVVDTCLGRLEAFVLETGGTLMITADHGNAEMMLDTDGTPYTAHTCNPVPLVVVNEEYQGASLESGGLIDVAPTVLDLLDLPCPKVMTGKTLLKRKEQRHDSPSPSLFVS